MKNTRVTNILHLFSTVIEHCKSRSSIRTKIASKSTKLLMQFILAANEIEEDMNQAKLYITRRKLSLSLLELWLRQFHTRWKSCSFNPFTLCTILPATCLCCVTNQSFSPCPTKKARGKNLIPGSCTLRRTQSWKFLYVFKASVMSQAFRYQSWKWNWIITLSTAEQR